MYYLLKFSKRGNPTSFSSVEKKAKKTQKPFTKAIKNSRIVVSSG